MIENATKHNAVNPENPLIIEIKASGDCIQVTNNIIPKVNPDLIHCNDWMTGLIPGMARRLGIPCLFTVHNIHTQKTTLEQIEDRGIDAAEFWNNLYFERQPYNYEESRSTNQVDFLTSGVKMVTVARRPF